MVTPVSSSIDEPYLKGTFQRPSYRQDPEKKHLEDYCVKVNEYMYYCHLQNETGIPLSEHDRFQRNRDYLYTRQGIGMYKDRFAKDISVAKYSEYESDNEEIDHKRELDRKGWSNIMWKLVDVCSKILDYYHTKYDLVEQDILATAIDQKSGTERQEIEATIKLFQDFGDKLGEITDLAGLPNISESITNTQGYKLLHEKFAEMLLKHTEEISDWLEIMKPKAVEDHISCGYIAARKLYNILTNKFEWEYCDPDPICFGIQSSKQRNFKDAEWGFVLKWEKVTSLIGKIRPGNPNEEYEIIKNNCQKYAGLYGNNPDYDYYLNEQSWFENLGDFRVPVMHSNWVDYDIERRLIFLSLTGTPLRSIDLRYDEFIPKKELKKLRGKEKNQKIYLKQKNQDVIGVRGLLVLKQVMIMV